MFSQPVRSVMERKKLLKTSPETTVSRAAKLMAVKGVGAIVIVDEKRVVGIFTERDALVRVLAEGLDAEKTPLSRVMTKTPKTIGPHVSFGRALATMYEFGFRHLPVVENDEPIGIVSTRNAFDPELEEFRCETHRRKHFLAHG